MEKCKHKNLEFQRLGRRHVDDPITYNVICLGCNVHFIEAITIYHEDLEKFISTEYLIKLFKEMGNDEYD